MKIVTSEEAEQADAVICVRATVSSTFTDDEYGPCSICGEEVRFRPHAPKRPPRVCLECATEMLGATRQ